VKLLLARNDVDPNKPDADGTTPLWRASWHGHEGVVKLLLAQADVNPNKPNNRLKRHSGAPATKGMKGWWRYCSRGTMSTMKSEGRMAEHHSGAPPGRAMRGW